MRRNWNVVRAVLLACERGDDAEVVCRSLNLDSDTIAHHYSLLDQGGYIVRASSKPRLTPAGQDMIDTIRDDGVWAKCQIVIEANAGGLPTEVLMALARGCISRRPDPDHAFAA